MKGIRALGATVFVALALTLAVLPISGASAAKTLTLTKEGKAVANGSPASTGLIVDECVIWSEDTVNGNGTSKVVLKASKNISVECPAGVTESGVIGETQLSAGKVTLKGTIAVTQPGPCIYAFKTFKTTFADPGPVSFEGKTTGKLAKGSSKSCAKTNPQSWVGDAAPEPFTEPFNAQ